MKKNEASQHSVKWVDIVDPSAEAVAELRRDFNFPDAVSRDFLTQGQRPKLLRHDGSVSMVLLFPIYQRDTRQIRPGKLDIVIRQNGLITAHGGDLPGLAKQFENFAQGKIPAPVSRVVLSLLEQLFQDLFPMLDHVSKDLHTIDEGIFHGRERKMVREILLMRRNTTEFRRLLQTHKRTIERLLAALAELGWLSDADLVSRGQQLVEVIKDIWMTLENYNDTIHALQQTNESLISFRLNDIMKNYTTISVVIFSMTLMTAILAAEATDNPLLGLKNGFLLLIGIVTLTGLGMVQYFRQKRWL